MAFDELASECGLGVAQIVKRSWLDGYTCALPLLSWNCYGIAVWHCGIAQCWQVNLI